MLKFYITRPVFIHNKFLVYLSMIFKFISCRAYTINSRLAVNAPPWSRVILKKLIVTQLANKFHAFYGTRRFIIVFTKARHWSLY
jgi:hypothetical protein